jgi:archaemetzincin
LSALSEHSILISPIRIYEPELLSEIRYAIHSAFGYPVIISSLLEDITFAYYPGRGQYNSTAILQKLEELAPPGVLKVIAVTRVDLFIPILTYVYGEAQLGGRSCVVSTHRLMDDSPISFEEKKIRERILKEAVHELGHTFNIRHCNDPMCIMHFCRSVEDVDRKSDRLCRYCRVLLEDEKKRLADDPLPAG